MTVGTDRRDRLRKLAHRVRAIPGEQFGLRPHTVAIVSAVWSGDHTGDGTATETTTPIVEANGQPPKVRWLKDEQLAVGQLPKGTCTIGPITPDFAGGGTEVATLVGSALSTGATLHVLITGPQHPSGATYRVTNVSEDRALHYTLQAEPVSGT